VSNTRAIVISVDLYHHYVVFIAITATVHIVEMMQLAQGAR